MGIPETKSLFQKAAQSAAFAVSRMTQVCRANKRFGGYAELVVQVADHGKGEPALVVENLRDPGTAPHQRFQVLPRYAAALHPVLDRFHRRNSGGHNTHFKGGQSAAFFMHRLDFSATLGYDVSA